MKKEDIKSEELRDILCVKTDRWDYEEITDEDLSSVRSVEIPGRKLTGELTDINLRELTALNHLEELTIMDFEISDSINDILKELPELKVLKFGNCDFNDCSSIKTVKGLRVFSIFGGKNVNMTSFPSAQFVQFDGVEVPFGSIDFDTLRNARFDHCRVIDAFDVEDRENVEGIEFIDSLMYSKKDGDGKRKKMEILRVPDGATFEMEYSDEDSLDR